MLRTKDGDEARFSGASSSFEEDQVRLPPHLSTHTQHGAQAAGAARQARRRVLLERAEWMQIRVRFLALEVPTVRAAPGAGDEPPHVARGPAEIIGSTWTFEGRLWLMGPMDPAEDIPARWRKARRRNPDLVWRLIKIRA